MGNNLHPLLFELQLDSYKNKICNQMILNLTILVCYSLILLFGVFFHIGIVHKFVC